MDAIENDWIMISAAVKLDSTELSFRYSGSSGPGGQHVNKTATKVTLRFDVANSPNLTVAQKGRILERLANRVDSQGVLQIQAQSTRSQRQNRALAVERLRVLLAGALQQAKPRRPSRPSATAVAERLRHKQKQSQKKQARQKSWAVD